MDNDHDSVAEQMNRDLFLAPELIDEDEDEDPLLEQARQNVEEEAEEAEEHKP